MTNKQEDNENAYSERIMHELKIAAKQISLKHLHICLFERQKD